MVKRRWLLTVAMVAAVGAGGQTAGTHFKFDFGPGKTEAGCVRVLPSDVYDEARGYGFELGSAVQGVDRGGRDRLRGDFITSDKAPFYFSVRVPEEGNYRVTVVLGDRQGESVTTVKAELRRLMVEKAATAKGKFEKREFIVNVRRPQISTGGEVRLKDREKTFEAQAWDDKLTLEFTNRLPAVCGVEIMKVDDLPTVFIVGDSTSTDQPREPFNSWGQMLTRFFKADIGVANHGESGESLRGFLGEKRWAKVMSVLRRGDYVLIQMGHNDQKEKGEGVGAMTTYKADLKRFVAEARERGATPILVTPVNRLTFGEDGKITNSLGDYPEAVRQAAREEGVAVIDLNAMSKLFYEAMGPVEAHQAFAGKDTTHHSNYGSYELAKCIVEGLKQAKSPLAEHLLETPRFDPSHPDPVAAFEIPAEPNTRAPRPYGDVQR